MKIFGKITAILVLFVSISQAYKGLEGVVIPLSKTKFKVIENNSSNEHIVDLKGKDFIVISVREKGADGIAYAVDKDGVVWWGAEISSGAKGYETPSGIYRVIRKERYHMSKQHPDPKGVNNMDFSMFFTDRGHALHMGNTNAMSHGCIHVGEKGANTMFKWSNYKTQIVVTREHYLPFVYNDLLKTGYRVNKDTPARIKNYIKTMKVVEPSDLNEENNNTHIHSEHDGMF